MRNDSPTGSRPRRTGMLKKWSAVETIIFLNIAIFFCIQPFFNQNRTNNLFLSNTKLAEGEVWRLVTYMFCHAGLMHLVFNMFMLYMLGRLVEQKLGKARFYHLYMLSGILSASFWLLFNDGSLVGASGAIFGIVAAAGMIAPNMRIMLLFPPIPMKLKTFILFLIGIEVYYKLQESQDNVAHLVHLSGALIGFLYIKYLADKDNFTFVGIKKWFGGKRAQSVRGKFTFVNDTTMKAVDYDIDKILDKIGQTGLKSLTSKEKAALEAARKKLKKNK